MEHLSSWLQASLLPPKWDVCGVICDATSVWHVFILASLGNAYYVGGEVTKDSAAELLLFCSRSHKNGARMFVDQRYRSKNIKRIHRYLSEKSMDEINVAIDDYMSACLRVPQHKKPETKSGGSSTAAAPVEYVLVDSFISMGLEQAWDMPYAMARCLLDARRNILGHDDTLESTEEERRYDEIIKRRKELDSAKKKG